MRAHQELTLKQSWLFSLLVSGSWRHLRHQLSAWAPVQEHLVQPPSTIAVMCMSHWPVGHFVYSKFLLYSLVQWNWLSDITGCMKFRCIQWCQRTNFTAPGCNYTCIWPWISLHTTHSTAKSGLGFEQTGRVENRLKIVPWGCVKRREHARTQKNLQKFNFDRVCCHRPTKSNYLWMTAKRIWTSILLAKIWMHQQWQPLLRIQELLVKW